MTRKVVQWYVAVVIMLAVKGNPSCCLPDRFGLRRSSYISLLVIVPVSMGLYFMLRIRRLLALVLTVVATAYISAWLVGYRPLNEVWDEYISYFVLLGCAGVIFASVARVLQLSESAR
ncbi:hypothetical protein [Corynebacterium sp.]|uniref:hypothetical protein n=1 Tax=Corynebacterium sp. TaxID=1720 RepID=UPI0028A5E63E|nr:hypothetical protein [Corynebacterium sp.]